MHGTFTILAILLFEIWFIFNIENIVATRYTCQISFCAIYVEDDIDNIIE